MRTWTWAALGLVIAWCCAGPIACKKDGVQPLEGHGASDARQRQKHERKETSAHAAKPAKPAKPDTPDSGVLRSFDSPPAVGTKARCPVMGTEFEVKEDTLRSEHKGRHYAFCCPMCKPKFDADPEKYTDK